MRTSLGTLSVALAYCDAVQEGSACPMYWDAEDIIALTEAGAEFPDAALAWALGVTP